MIATLRRGLVVACLLSICACGGPILRHGQLSVLDKGITRTEVSARLGQPPLSTHTASAGGRDFEFDRYRLDNGLQVELYLLAYERDRLLYWGYVYEFRRQPDRDLDLALGRALPGMSAAGGR